MNVALKYSEAQSAGIPSDLHAFPGCERVLALLHTHRGDPLAEINRVLADDPSSIFGHCLRLALIVLADKGSARADFIESLAAVDAANGALSDRAHRHASAARAWLDGDTVLAAERYGAIVIDCPRDILALVVAHALDFRLGRQLMLRDRIAQVLPAWGETMSGYASVLAMYAFGLEENGQYRRAERTARRALALEPGHPEAIHVIAHVMEMQARTQEGLDFLAATERAWAKDTGFSVHLAWHRALFHVDADDLNSALSTYDAQIASVDPPGMNTLADASSLLWRLELRNVSLGRRWRRLADLWEMQSLDGARPFFVVHAMMAYAAARRGSAALRILNVSPRAEARRTGSALPEEALAPPFCQAVLAFTRGDYAACVEWLTRVRDIAHRCGGSLAQCDLIHLTYTEAALRAGKAGLARALVAERAAQKPASRLNHALQKRLG